MPDALYPPNGPSLSAVVGLVQFYFPTVLGGEGKAKKLYKWHRVAGYIITAGVIVNLTLGTQTPYFRPKVQSLAAWIVFDVLIVAGLVPRIKPAKMKLF